LEVSSYLVGMGTALLLFFGAPLFVYDMFLRGTAQEIGRRLANTTGRVDLQRAVMPWWQPAGAAILWTLLALSFAQSVLSSGVSGAFGWLALFVLFAVIASAVLTFTDSRHYLLVIRSDLVRRRKIFAQYGKTEKRDTMLLILEHFTSEYLPDEETIQAEAG